MSFNLPKTVPTLLLAGSVIAGCGGDTKGSAGRADAGADSVSSAPAAAEVKIYTVHGIPTTIDSAKGVVMVDHEKIEGFMDAMTMPFEVADPALLGQMTIGKRALFTIRVQGWEMAITKVEPEQPAK